MSRIVVVGAHGRTGRLIVEQLIANGDTVVATIRNPKHMAALVKAGAETVILDLEASPGPEFARVFKAADAIVFAAGSSTGESSEIDSRGVRKTLGAARKAGVKRYVAISSIGASTGMRLSVQWATDEMKDYYKHKRLAGKAIMASGLDWTIVEPGELTDVKRTGKVTLSQQAIEESSVPRADVAAVVVALLGEPGTAGKALQLIAGKTRIADAVARVGGTAGLDTAKPVIAKAPAKRQPARKAPAKTASTAKPVATNALPNKPLTAKTSAARKAPAKAPARKAAR